jgi:tRNA (adenine37-N6)-methyltransferase
MIKLEIIGIAKTCFKEKFCIPRQAGLSPNSYGSIILSSPFNREESLRGLESFSHIMIFFSAHLSKSSSLVVRPPRLGGNKKIGVFATRSPFRPNGICSSIVKLDNVDHKNGVINFSNHDILNQSPIIDIKPYIPKWDIRESATNGWIEEFSDKNNLIIDFDNDLEIKEKIKKIISEVLSLDPRPSYKQSTKELKTYAFRLDNYDVHFKYISENRILVFKVIHVI